MANPSAKLVVTRAHAHSAHAVQAVQQVAEQLGNDPKSVVVLFCSSKYDLTQLGPAIREAFACPVLGCTTSGEVGPDGYDEFSISGFALYSPRLEVYPQLIDTLSEFHASHLSTLTGRVVAQKADAAARIPGGKSFGFLLIDGMSVKEEEVISNLHAVLGGMPIVGGSAGDDLKFERTHIYFDGEFRTNAACFAHFFTTHPFEIFKTQHFEPTAQKLVVTQATPELRIVTTLNGRPAAAEYARIIGVEPDRLGPELFSLHPVMLKIAGEYYVRSIQKVNPDGGLSFYCAIDKGVVLTVGTGTNILEDLEQTLATVEQRTNAGVIIGCECILRRLEILDRQIADAAGRIMNRHKVIGFHTYGEQINSIHVNQTFTGVAIGDAE